MTEETVKGYLESIAQAKTDRGDKLALAVQGRNELIELAWDIYEAAKAQAHEIWEATEKDIDLAFDDELAAIEVEMAASTGPAADQLPETVGTPEYDYDPVTVGETVSPKPPDETLGGTEIDIIYHSRHMVAKLYAINESYYRSQGERRVVSDGLQALADMMSGRLAELKAHPNLMPDESEKGGNTDEVNESGG